MIQYNCPLFNKCKGLHKSERRQYPVIVILQGCYHHHRGYWATASPHNVVAPSSDAPCWAHNHTRGEPSMSRFFEHLDSLSTIHIFVAI